MATKAVREVMRSLKRFIASIADNWSQCIHAKHAAAAVANGVVLARVRLSSNCASTLGRLWIWFARIVFYSTRSGIA
jgi:hypothetical protein